MVSFMKSSIRVRLVLESELDLLGVVRQHMPKPEPVLVNVIWDGVFWR